MMLWVGLLLPLISGACDVPRRSPEKRAVMAPIVVKALVTNVFDEKSDKVRGDLAEIWIIDVYKGADKLAANIGVLGGPGGILNIRDQRVNVSGWDLECGGRVPRDKAQLILLASSNHRISLDPNPGPVIPFTQELKVKILKVLGWFSWSSWGTCSVTCGGGSQERWRKCRKGSECEGYNTERRVCNSFSCKGAVNAIAVEDSRYFKPYRRSFQSVHDRPGAWRIKTGSYFLLPYHQVFGRHFPHDFTIFLTFKPYKDTEGVIVSLNDPNSRQEYLSLELSKTKGHHLKMVHSTQNGTRVVSIPAPILTNNWNQLAISVEDGSSIRTYLDCNWVTTQILHGHALAVPPKPDLIIGYMFQGEIEQLTVSDKVGSAGEQCSTSRLPLQDDTLEEPLHFSTKQSSSKSSRLPLQDDTLEDSLHFSTKQSSSKISSKVSSTDIVIDEESDNQKGVEHLDYTDEEYVDLDSPEEEPEERLTQDVSVKMEIVEDDVGSGQDTLESSGDKSPIITLEEEDKEEEDGSGGYELDWSTWSECSATCGSSVQTRWSRCADNGFMMECIAAGMERRVTRACRKPTCSKLIISPSETPNNKNRSSWITTNSQQISNSLSQVEDAATLDIEDLHPNHVTDKDIAASRKRKSSFSEKSTLAIKLNRSGDLLKITSNNHKQQTPTDESEGKKITSSKTLTQPTWKDASDNHCGCKSTGICDSQTKLCQCVGGWTGKDCGTPVCRPACSNGAACVQPDVCECTPGYTGARCQKAFCHPPCANGGLCIAPFKCGCPNGTRGNYCQKPLCHRKCQNGGTCVGPNQCSCLHGFSGVDCGDRTCNLRCQNGGVCTSTNTCKCPKGFYGSRCHKTICHSYVAVREPQKRAYRRVISLSPATEDKPARPKYKTFYKTYYKTVYKCKQHPEKLS